ncbi:hypothetical protein [Pelagibacterium halotolerans]|uniref:Uncharacterized protein n=1 Tax=Pelagibacterium halotolerans (strain DSM 22347 / JCM 15775 / CGMCC 1.7692 / B2) TaxID=1082931 RepID=G4RF29_PELHB|nr:hypothetical protein [Pelagibacterium halotolerans]AEQ52962.1 hypothetical protein KKY_2968 [Pelagibacterium halotolerans B2]QJR17376.1 hypothetical protein HKM20_02220 [Pelagibacterium halotolerans]SEA97406.1 hypothetical protein SAMN05428936_1163 [Pelagibacterium halotolerans]
MSDPLKSDGGKDARAMQRIGLILVALCVLWLAAAALMVVNFGGLVEALDAGLGWREAAVLAFFASTSLVIVFTLVAGDGLLGELQFLIPGFFMLFGFFWLGLVLLF